MFPTLLKMDVEGSRNLQNISQRLLLTGLAPGQMSSKLCPKIA
jgi:hypothetical protein